MAKVVFFKKLFTDNAGAQALWLCFVGLAAWMWLLPPVATAQDIAAVALFKDKAVLTIGGKRRVLSVGEVSAEGVELLSADSEQAVVKLRGERRTLYVGGQTGLGGYAPPAERVVQIYSDPLGMFTTTGSLNGHTVDLLVDTGATMVAMNANEAKRLGIDFRFRGRKGQVSTASGIADAYYVTLKSARVGEIELRDVEAVVIDGEHPTVVLLGMSFLSRLHMERQGSALMLKQRF